MTAATAEDRRSAAVSPGGPAPFSTWARLVWVAVGLAALAEYLLPRIGNPAAHWPLFDVSVYWWGGNQALHGGALYASGAPFHFTYTPLAAALFGIGADASVGALEAAITAASVCALVALCWLLLGAAGVRRRPETVFGLTALSLLAVPVAETLHLGEVDLILAALIGVDVLPRRDGHRWQGICTGLAAGIKLTPLIFVAYLLITRRLRAAAVAAATFVATVAAGFVLLPSQSRAYWFGGLFLNEHRVADPANQANQSLLGAFDRLSGGIGTGGAWWLAAALATAVAGIAVAAWAHRRGHRLLGVACCGITGLLVSPVSWTHHWVWAVPLVVWAIVTSWRRRSLLLGLAAAALALVFSELIPIPAPGSDPSPARLLAGDPYVLCGLIVLAAVAAALWRERAVAAAKVIG